MKRLEDLDDGALLAATDVDAEAFGVFYRRHLAQVVGWLHGHVRDGELAADLTGEVFAAALRARGRFDARRGSAAAWLQAIARNTLIDSVRRGRVEDRARRAVGVEQLTLDDEDLAAVDELVDQAGGHTPASDALAMLPDGQAAAVRARVLAEDSYDDIARRLRCSPAVVRQRVSRGLRAMRANLEEQR